MALTAKEKAENRARESAEFWSYLDIEMRERPEGSSGLLPFDVVMSRFYRRKNLPYVAHNRSGGIINVATGQVAIRDVRP